MKSLIKIFILTAGFYCTLFSQSINWEKQYGGETTIEGFDCLKTFDNNYVVVGYYGPDKNSFIMKMNAFGDTLWLKVFNLPINSEAIKVLETNDTGYLIVSNYSNYQLNIDNILVTKTNVNGDTIWNKTYTPGLKTFAQSVIKTSSNCFLINGFCVENDTMKSWLLELDSLGNRIWEKIIKRGSYSSIEDIIQIDPNYFLFIGYSEAISDSIISSVWISRINNLGEIVIEKLYQRFDNQYPQKIIKTNDANYLAIINKSNEPSNDDIWLVKFDENCDTIWTKDYPTNQRTVGLSIKENIDGSIFSVGYRHPPNNYSASDVLVTKYSSSGDIIWEQFYGNGSQESGKDMELLGSDKIFVLASRYNSSTWNHEVWVFELTDNTSSVVNEGTITDFYLYNNFPNPFNPSTKIQFELNKQSYFELIIFDVVGKIVKTWAGEKSAGLYTLVWDGRDDNNLEVASGIYFFQLKSANSIQTKKLVLVR